MRKYANVIKTTMLQFLASKYSYLSAGIVGIPLTILAIRAAYLERGYIAFGGELLIIPLLLLIVFACRYLVGEWSDINE